MLSGRAQAMTRQEVFLAWCREQGIHYELNKPLSGLTWVGIGGPADILVSPHAAHLPEMLVRLRSCEIPYYILGKGSNVLISDTGVRGVVIGTDQLTGLAVDSERFVIEAGAGNALQQIIQHAAENGFSGSEGLAGIPGTVAGAVAGNAGSFGAEIADVVQAVEMALPDGTLRGFSPTDLHFGYRCTDIPPGAVITSVRLHFGQADAEELLRRVRQFRTEKRAHQPVAERSLGCVFKNPPVNAAGRLIEEAGCKGLRQGGIVVSSVHANFFVNQGGGSALDYLTLMRQVQDRVLSVSGIPLDPEIRMVGEWGVH